MKSKEHLDESIDNDPATANANIGLSSQADMPKIRSDKKHFTVQQQLH